MKRAAIVGVALLAFWRLDLRPSSITPGNVVFSLPPYLKIAGVLYSASSMYAVTLPTASPSWINGVTPTAIAAAGPNGDYIAATVNSAAWGQQSCTSSVEGEFFSASLGTGTNAGIWIYDSTNSRIWELSAGGGNNVATLQLRLFTYAGSGNPALGSNIVVADQPPPFGVAHFKIVVAAGTASFEYSQNGGKTFIPLTTTESVGTIAACGFDVSSSAISQGSIDLLSLVTQ